MSVIIAINYIEHFIALESFNSRRFYGLVRFRKSILVWSLILLIPGKFSFYEYWGHQAWLYLSMKWLKAPSSLSYWLYTVYCIRDLGDRNVNSPGDNAMSQPDYSDWPDTRSAQHRIVISQLQARYNQPWCTYAVLL